MLALDINALRKTYSSGFEALKGINLQVEQGDFFALLGPNGAGKSTTIGIMTSLIKKTSGSLSIYGYDIDHAPVQAKALLGVVPQEFNFNPFNTIFNIVYLQAGYYGFSGKTAKARVDYLLRALGLWEKRHDKAMSLSGGMKRRLMIARALVHSPKFLILDEPTAGVDVELRRSMWDFLQETNREGTTIVLTTHYLEEAEQLCNKIAIINHGHIIENTDKKALLQKVSIETIVLDLKVPLVEMPDLAPYVYRQIDSISIEIDINKEQNVNDLFSILSTKGIEVMSFRNKTNRLEELFVRLTQQEKS
jgi:ABC-2 type transport system ATP-binding protein